MTLAQAKKQCREQHKGKRHTENFYLVKHPAIGWKIATPAEFSTANTKAIDFQLFTLD